MDLDKDKLYNPDVKLHYLEDGDISESSIYPTYNLLVRTAKTERRLKKDLYEMHEKEIEEVLYELKQRNDRSVMVSYSKIKAYIDWAGRIYSNKKFPLFAGEVFSQIAHRYASTSLLNLYKQEELFEIYEELENVYDILIIQALFEGIKGKRYSELANIKVDDLYTDSDKYFIHLYNTEDGTERDLEITRYLYDLIIKANEVKKYKDYETGKETILNSNSPYVLKKSTRGKIGANGHDLRIGDIFIYSKTPMFKKKFEAPSFKLSDIQYSGLMHYLYEIIKDQPQDVKVVSNDALKTVGDKFGIKQYLQTDVLKNYTPYSLIKDRIEEDYFRENYTDFIYSK